MNRTLLLFLVIGAVSGCGGKTTLPHVANHIMQPELAEFKQSVVALLIDEGLPHEAALVGKLEWVFDPKLQRYYVENWMISVLTLEFERIAIQDPETGRKLMWDNGKFERDATGTLFARYTSRRNHVIHK